MQGELLKLDNVTCKYAASERLTGRHWAAGEEQQLLSQAAR